MALIKCPECNKMISDKARLCPQCGYPIQDSICYQNFSPEKVSVSKRSLDAIIEHANLCFEVGAYCKKEIIDLLMYEGYSSDVAFYVANNLDVNWEEQAVLKVYEYFKIKPFSREEMMGQLEYDGFTPAEISFAINKVYKESF